MGNRAVVGGLCALLFLATCALFWPSIGHGRCVYDDPVYVTSSGDTRAAVGADERAFSANPLAWATLRWEDRLFGRGLAGHHAGNVLLHALSGVFVFLFLTLMTGATWHSSLAAAIYALHPLRVEPVAWIAERKEVQAGCLAFLSLVLYARYAAADRTRARCVWYGATLTAFALALLSKPTVITLAFLMLLLDVWPMHRLARPAWLQPGIFPQPSGRFAQRSPRFLLAEKIPFILAALAVTAVSFVIDRSGSGAVGNSHVALFGRAVGPGQRVANAIVSHIRYLERMAWFSKLAIPYPMQAWPFWKVALAATLLGGATLLAIGNWRRWPWLMVGWLWFLGALAPMNEIVQLGTHAMADRYTYIPAVGMAIAAVWSIPPIAARSGRAIALVASLVVVAYLFYCSRIQLSYWSDDVALFNHSIAVTRDNSMAHALLGSVYRERQDWPAAERELRAALVQDSDSFMNVANLAQVLSRQGRHREATDYGVRAVALNPRSYYAHLAYAEALERAGDAKEAAEQFEAAEQIDSTQAFCHFRLGTLLAQLGQSERGNSEIKAAIALDPAYARSHDMQAAALAAAGDFKAAVLEYRAAIGESPGSAHLHVALGTLLSDHGDHTGAMEQFNQAVALDPASAEALINRGLEYASMNKFEAARADYENALRAEPDHPDVHLNLGALLLAQGKNEASAAQSLRALELRPDSADAAYNLGMAEMALGRLDDAQSHLRFAMRLAPNDAQTRQALAELDRRRSRLK